MRLIFVPVTAVIALLSPPGSTGRAQWNPPERITTNTYEEQTNPGSLAIDGNDLLHLTWIREHPDSGGTQVLYMEGSSGNWGDMVGITPGNLFCSKPDIAVQTNGASHIVWLQGSGDAGEIYYATNSSGAWVTERITTNTTMDIHPVIAVDGDNIPHAAWAGFDTQSGEGKIFYADRSSGAWQIEVLSDSYIGDFWTGAAPSVSVSAAGIVQIAYRGGDYGTYHIHQATNATGDWVIQELTSGNLNDFNSSVRTDYYGDCFLAMSGNDGWGFPYRVYYTESSNGGISWSPRLLATGAYSATSPVLGIDWYGNAHVAWEQVSGNILTGTIFYTTNETGPWTSQAITGIEENYSPSVAMDGSGGVHVLYVNMENLVSDSTEVFYLTNSAPILTITMVAQGETVIPRGETLALDLAVTNETDGPVTGDLWFTGIVAATGAELLIPPAFLNIPNPLHGTIPAGRSLHGTLRVRTPAQGPTGLFTLVGSLGDYTQGTYLDRAAVSVRVIP